MYGYRKRNVHVCVIFGIDKDALSQTIDMLGGVSYQVHARAVTITPGPNETIIVTTKECGKLYFQNKHNVKGKNQ